MLSGTLRAAGDVLSITNGRMVGEHITFTAGGAHYSGRLRGNDIEGMRRSEAPWSAAR
jgi:hypothetical protein